MQRERVRQRAKECPLWFSEPVVSAVQSWASQSPFQTDQTGQLPAVPGLEELPLAPAEQLRQRVMKQGNFLVEPDVVEEVLDEEASELRAWQRLELGDQQMDYRIAVEGHRYLPPVVGRSRTTDRQNRVSDWESADLSWTPDWAFW